MAPMVEQPTTEENGDSALVPEKLTAQRMSGLLLHPTSLSGSGPIGTLGAQAHAFVDFLAKSRQSIWQMLPTVPTFSDSSPYASPSAFARNVLLLDSEHLWEQGLLSREALDADRALPPSTRVDFGGALNRAQQLVETAFRRFSVGKARHLEPTYRSFVSQNRSWLEDYALFTTLRQRYDRRAWPEWPVELASRENSALVAARDELAHQVDQVSFGQFLFELQWEKLREHATASGVQLVGDIPIYVAFDSADVWANQAVFGLDETGWPAFVAGVPPDYFSKTGQRWGNPLYCWETLKERDYDWWVKRFKRDFEHFDAVRIDHFRGFDEYWSIPRSEETAVVGEWLPGPGADLFRAVEATLGPLSVIAEDLGIITSSVRKLRRELGFPGMKILQFAFSGEKDHPYLPENYENTCCVVYPGTHDNNTTVGWFESLTEEELQAVETYFGRKVEQPHWDLIELGWRSKAAWAITTVQDLLGLDGSARMNTPAQASGNWGWRMEDGALTPDLAKQLATLTDTAGRIGNRE